MVTKLILSAENVILFFYCFNVNVNERIIVIPFNSSVFVGNGIMSLHTREKSKAEIKIRKHQPIRKTKFILI